VVVKAAALETGGGGVVQATGWVEPDPYPIAVSALTDGVVKEVLVLENSAVTAGQVVARLVDDDARLALARAEAELAHKTATLAAAQRTWDNPVERTRAVAAAEAMAEETKAELARLPAEVAAAAAMAEQARQELRRVERLVETPGAVSELEVIQARQRFEAQEATLRATRQKQPVLEQQLRQREAELTAARDNQRLRIEETGALDEAKAAVALAQAARDEAKLRLDRTEVRSPADGVVMTRLAEPGAKLYLSMDHPHSAQAVRLYDPKRLQVRVDVPLADAAKVAVGQRAQVVVAALPDRTFEGKVSRVVNEADVQKNTLQFKVAIADPSPVLKPEMLARVKFLAPVGEATTRPSQLVFAPESLIQKTEGGAKAWVVDTRRGVAALRAVQPTETRQDGWVAVTDGLHAGDRLIADPSGLSDGQRVKVTGEAPAPKGGSHGAH
jgi:RND family efflux transporter MFP subunit